MSQSTNSPDTGARRLGRRHVVLASLAVAAVAVAGVIGATLSKPDQAPAASDAVDASLEMLDGGTASLADHRGRPLVVNFFASWCAPCLAEMPGFEQVHQDLADDVGFLGVNLQDPVENGRLVVEHTGVSYDIARDPDGSLFVQLGGFAMPTTVFIDETGVIVDLHSGELTADALRDRIAEVLL